MIPFSHSLRKKGSCGYSCLDIVARRTQNGRALTVPRCPTPGLTAVPEQGGAQVVDRVEVRVLASSYQGMPYGNVSLGLVKCQAGIDSYSL